jgi:ubiquinone/menaquinone biosynthesis C-methylase UbiE
MGYVFDFNTAAAYEKWFNKPNNVFSADLQNQLIIDLLKPHRNESVLGIGCGTGASLKPFLDRGLQTTAIDTSPYMLDIKQNNLGHRVDLHRGVPENLPFEDNSFNYTCLIHCLEFSDNPKKAIEEACRTAKDKLYISAWNKYAIKNAYRRIQGIFYSTFFNRARFFSIWELKQILKELLGNVPISWKTACQLPSATQRISQRFEESKIVQRCPFGEYTGMVVTLVPRLRTTPIPLKYKAKATRGVLTPKKSLNANKQNNSLVQ